MRNATWPGLPSPGTGTLSLTGPRPCRTRQGQDKGWERRNAIRPKSEMHPSGLYPRSLVWDSDAVKMARQLSVFCTSAYQVNVYLLP
jgi:hypothetical protein